MGSTQISSALDSAKVALKNTVSAPQPKAAEPAAAAAPQAASAAAASAKAASAAAAAKSEFVQETKPQKKVTLDPTAGQKPVTAFTEVSQKLPATVSARSLQLTGGKSANQVFTDSPTADPTAAASEAIVTSGTALSGTQAKVAEGSQRISEETKKNGAAAGVRTMEQLLEERKNDPDFEEYRRQLLIAAEPTITALASQSQRQQPNAAKEQEVIDAVTQLASISNAAGSEATQRAARAYAAGMDDNRTLYEPGSPQTEALRKALEQGGAGAAFGTALTQELAATGKSATAERVGQELLLHVDELRADFQAKTTQVQELNALLQRAMEDAGPGLTEAQREKIASDFKAKHGDVYDQWEAAAAKLTPYLESPSALEQFANNSKLSPELRASASSITEATAGLMDQLGNSREGAKWVAREMMKEAGGEKTLLAQMGGLAKDRKDLADKLAVALGKGAAWAAVEGAKAGVPLPQVMKGLENHSDLFGLSKEGMSEVTELFGQFKPGMSNEQVQELSKKLKDKLAAVESGTPPFGADGARGQLLRGIGVAISAASLTGDWQQFPGAGLDKQIKTIADTIGTGADGITLVLDVIGKGESIAKIMEAAGPAASAVSAIVDGLTAVDAFMRGDKGQALESGLMSAGSLLLAGASLQIFPVGGQIVGAALVATSIGVKLFNEHQKAQQVDELRNELLGSVFKDDPKLKEAFLHADRKQLQKLVDMGLSPEQIQRLGSATPALFGQMDGSGLEGIQKMQRTFHMSTSELEEFLLQVGGKDDEALLGFIYSMDTHNGLASDSLSREEWITAFEDLSGGSTDVSQAYRRAAEYLRALDSTEDWSPDPAAMPSAA